MAGSQFPALDRAWNLFYKAAFLSPVQGLPR